MDDDTEQVPGKPNKRDQRGTWMRIAAWIAGSLVLLVLAGVVAITALVNTDGVHRYLLGWAQRKASEVLGVRV
jgi:hypothetical protein